MAPPGCRASSPHLQRREPKTAPCCTDRRDPLLETTLDVLFHAVYTAYEAGEISDEQYQEALTYLRQLKG